jgi:hypothetical protein
MLPLLRTWNYGCPFLGINLLFFKMLFEKQRTAEVVVLLKIEPTGI